MFANTNDALAGRVGAKIAEGGELVSQRFELALTTPDLTANHIGAIGLLAAACVPVAVYVDSDDLDTGGTPAVQMSVGILNDAGTAFDTTWGTGIKAGQAGTAEQVVSPALLRTEASDDERTIGLQITTAPAAAKAGTVGVTVIYHTA